MANDNTVGLNLVFDTNTFVEAKDGLKVFNDLRDGLTGTLPSPVRLFVPYMVKQELQYLSKGKRSPRRASAAKAAHDMILSIRQNDGTVTIQTKRQSSALERDYFPSQSERRRSVNDGLILLYSLLSIPNGDVWLVTRDNQLTARCARSSLQIQGTHNEHKVVGMTLETLKQAMGLNPYAEGNPNEEAYYWLAISDSDSDEDDYGRIRDTGYSPTPSVSPERSEDNYHQWYPHAASFPSRWQNTPATLDRPEHAESAFKTETE